MFAKKQPGQLRQRLNDVKMDHFVCIKLAIQLLSILDVT